MLSCTLNRFAVKHDCLLSLANCLKSQNPVTPIKHQDKMLIPNHRYYAPQIASYIAYNIYEQTLSIKKKLNGFFITV